ncbi:MAG: hypothetical protein B5M53_09575 [Candidatus Cloacimonas sp. 4484_209]|nr:MAG: hypothetical protein B5M53_09575 [Candidatus Cloacimonas sp. 4484_209]
MVAVDTMTTITTVLLVILSLIFKRRIYLDVALVYAVLAYIKSCNPWCTFCSFWCWYY